MAWKPLIAPQAMVMNERPDGKAGRVGIHKKVGVGQNGAVAEHERTGKPEGHYQQQDREEGVDTPDDGINGHDRGKEVVGEDERGPEGQAETRQVGEQDGGAEHEHSADHDHERDGEHFHEAADAGAEVAPDDLGIGRSAVAQGHHG